MTVPPRSEENPRERPLRVLVVDDEPNIRKALSICLQGIGCQVQVAGGEREALEAARHGAPDLVLLDLRLGDADGLALLPTLLESSPEPSVVVMTAYASVETAVAAIRSGALDYLQKPFSPDLVRAHVARVRTATLDTMARAATSKSAIVRSARLRAPDTPEPQVGGDFTLAEIERAHVYRTLARHPIREEAARLLGIDPSTLWRKLKRYEEE